MAASPSASAMRRASSSSRSMALVERAVQAASSAAAAVRRWLSDERARAWVAASARTSARVPLAGFAGGGGLGSALPSGGGIGECGEGGGGFGVTGLRFVDVACGVVGGVQRDQAADLDSLQLGIDLILDPLCVANGDFCGRAVAAGGVGGGAGGVAARR
jgi:hypothetical protein